jgi:hypothetical protein
MRMIFDLNRACLHYLARMVRPLWYSLTDDESDFSVRELSTRAAQNARSRSRKEKITAAHLQDRAG